MTKPKKRVGPLAAAAPASIYDWDLGDWPDLFMAKVKNGKRLKKKIRDEFFDDAFDDVYLKMFDGITDEMVRTIAVQIIQTFCRDAFITIGEGKLHIWTESGIEGVDVPLSEIDFSVTKSERDAMVKGLLDLKEFNGECHLSLNKEDLESKAWRGVKREK